MTGLSQVGRPVVRTQAIGDTSRMDPVANPSEEPAGRAEQGEPAAAEQALRAALEEQRMVAEFGQEALRGRPLADHSNGPWTSQQALSVEFRACWSISPIRPLEMRAGRGWLASTEPPGSATAHTQVGAILASGAPLVVTDVLVRIASFSAATLALGIRSSIGVRILGPDRPRA